MLLGEVAVLVLEVYAVERDELSEQLHLDLLHEIVKGVPVNEGALLSRVRVQIKEEEEPAI